MKHAFLIMAHNQFEILEKLILLLDNEKNDLFIHIDSKVKNFDFKHFSSICKKSNIYFTKRYNINWGGFSQINCQVQILKESLKFADNKKITYDYFHYLSGVDLPIKSNKYIHDFFENNNETEFITFCSNSFTNSVKERYKFYYPLEEYIKSNEFANIVQKVFIKLQQIFKIDRTKKSNLEFYFGSNWVSITKNFAEYIISCENQIEKTYYLTHCCDEIFIQTAAMNSSFNNKISKDNFNDNYFCCLRFIDWKRGTPYIFTKKDFDELVSSPFLFARKFDLNVDSQIVDMIYNHIINLNLIEI